MSIFEMDAARFNREADAKQLTNITPFVRGIDEMNSLRNGSISRLKARLFVVEKEIVRCRESGPYMNSMCRERSAIRKSIIALGGVL